MKSNLPKDIMNVRRDLSSYVFHFVRRKPKKPLDTIISIINKKCIIGGKYSPCKTKTVCFTDAPLAEFIKQDKIFDKNCNNYSRLSKWGIGFKKDYIFSRGGLPVIYQPIEMFDSLNEANSWRHVTMDLDNGIDYTWQREWRVETELFEFDKNEAILVIPEFKKIYLYLLDGVVDCEDDHGELSYSGGISNSWNFIPLEHVSITDDKSIEVCKGNDFLKYLDEEEIGKIEWGMV